MGLIGDGWSAGMMSGPGDEPALPAAVAERIPAVSFLGEVFDRHRQQDTPIQ